MNPDTTLLALDRDVAVLYKNNNINSQKERKTIEHFNKDAIAAHMNFCRQIEELFYQPRYCRLKKYFMGGSGVPSLSREHRIGLATAEWLRDILQYTSALLPYLPQEQQDTFKQLEAHIMASDLVKESMTSYSFFSEKDASSVVEMDECEISVESIVSFANIWLDIDRLFMSDDLMDLKPFFYERRFELPDSNSIALCEGLTIRLLAAMKVSEDQLKHLPNRLVISYCNYKDMICESAMVNRVFGKYPFLYKELLVGTW